jgi:serine protease Do
VTKLASDGPAAAQGIELGDVIVSIDQQPATTPQQAAAELKQAAGNGSMLLLINRRGVSEFVGLSVNAGGSSTTSR